MNRCAWAQVEPSLTYHDTEWGVPVHDDRRLFEFLILEGAQAGLSWVTILKKRAAYRDAFDHFDPGKVAAYDEARIAALLANPGIVRNRAQDRGHRRQRTVRSWPSRPNSAASTPTCGASSAAGRW